jgi:hypothetical protein
LARFTLHHQVELSRAKAYTARMHGDVLCLAGHLDGLRTDAVAPGAAALPAGLAAALAAVAGQPKVSRGALEHPLEP